MSVEKKSNVKKNVDKIVLPSKRKNKNALKKPCKNDKKSVHRANEKSKKTHGNLIKNDAENLSKRSKLSAENDN